MLASRFQLNTRLESNQSYTEIKPVIPPNIPAGDYYVYAKTNIHHQILADETVFSNNTNFIRTAGGAAKKIHVIQPLLPDLVDTIITAPSTAAAGQPVTVGAYSNQ